MARTYVYFFGGGRADGNASMRDLLGGKGAGLAEMTNAGIPVPPGFTISTEACRLFTEGDGTLPREVIEQQDAALERLERLLGRKLGAPGDPLLVSVRSGAKFSMPGMMDTVLNLGLTPQSVEGLARRTANPRFAVDCYRRFIQMFGNVVLGVEKHHYEAALHALKTERRREQDTDLTEGDLRDVVETFLSLTERMTSRTFPTDPYEQLTLARDAVFRSWNNERARYYRKMEGIPDDLGTAVNVQSMVFGNTGDRSGTGVGFTRNCATGERVLNGEYLPNAQGEDVVAGIRTAPPLETLQTLMPDLYRELAEITDRLEKHYRDVQDFEFTVEDGRLWILQTRTAKRTGVAAVRIAVEMVAEGLIGREEALLRVRLDQLEQLLHPTIVPAAKAKATPIARGLAASPGAAVGALVLSADDAARRGHAGEKVILVRNETSPDDIHGMDAAQGILTRVGGMTSHAAVVARGMGRPCVAGAREIAVDEATHVLRVGDEVIPEGELLTLDGSDGTVYRGALPLAEPGVSGPFRTLLSWTDEFRRLKVRTNADTPKDAAKAREFGAEGIGLTRTEHMFFDQSRAAGTRTVTEQRIKHVVHMILAAPAERTLRREVEQAEADLARHAKDLAAAREARDRAAITRARTTHTAARRALTEAKRGWTHTRSALMRAIARIQKFQEADFLGIFRVMDGYPVTIRTLDPPLHEFLPRQETLQSALAAVDALRAAGLPPRKAATALRKEIAALEKRQAQMRKKQQDVPSEQLAELAAKRTLLEQITSEEETRTLLAEVEKLAEFNPMLGHRGCRLGITYPEITEMQVRAIFRAACAAAREKVTALPEVMIPLTGTGAEFRDQAEVVRRVAEEVIAEEGVAVRYTVGTMIEVPRAALVADEIARDAEFFSFGTNDLTQMTFGYSRDDAGKFLPEYVERKILPADPFVTLDQNGVGQLMRIAIERGRAARPGLKIGICGEHGGDPASIEFCHAQGLDYVSCSPYRVPVARLAAAQIVLREGSLVAAGSDTR
jgi:pyruvate,orthophosphate dikinase